MSDKEKIISSQSSSDEYISKVTFKKKIINHSANEIKKLNNQTASDSSSKENTSIELNIFNEEKKKFFNCKKICVRTAHLLLVLFVTGNLFFQNTKLRDALIQRDYVYLFCFVSLTYSSLLFFFLTCFKNPGYVEKQQVECRRNFQNDGLPNIKLRFCTYCHLEQPIRSRHCEECRRCVNKFDHHCPWLETCIGEKNHKYFWLFVGTTNILICWCIEITWSSFVSYSKWSTWLLKNLLFLFDAQVLVISFFLTLSLFLIHTYFMITNTTTWEKFSRKNITYLKILKNESNNPFHQSYLKNVYLFLFGPRDNTWENVYAAFFKSNLKESNMSNNNSENEVQVKIEKTKH
ncbi:putative palmitoyltransferase ZDHHC12 [Brachionus plicatilis]|uniref:Palmitoyltransferase n=1 Tax=Brachionus plicatilis TaxID=10195 RepID=A0A3M7RHZ2_BRAPC|nr:putative palmitoyltransferase ZDHHC12 [Brachionus plicatilis]